MLSVVVVVVGVSVAILVAHTKIRRNYFGTDAVMIKLLIRNKATTLILYCACFSDVFIEMDEYV